MTPAEHEQIDAQITMFTGVSIYHTHLWRRFLEQTLAVTSVVLAAYRGGELLAILPIGAVRRWRGGWRAASLPFSHYVPVAGAADVTPLLIAAATRLARDRYHCDLELRGAVAADAQSVVTTVVPLGGSLDDVRRRLDRKTRNQLTQAERLPVTLRPATAADDAELDRIMAINRRALGSATYPPGWFGAYRAIGQDHAALTVAVVDGRPAAFMAYSVYGASAIYHYGASLAEFRPHRPNNLLMWNALRWTRERGATHFDLGTSLPQQQGLIHFKEGWGGQSRPLAYVRRSVDGRQRPRAMLQETPAAKLAAAVIRRLPLAVYRLATPPLLKEFG